jgi:hypothetical protein
MAENPQDSFPRTAISQAERRTHPRRELNASVEVIDSESGAQLQGQLSDLAMGGCYVKTSDPLPIGTTTKVAITKDARTIKPQARVVSTHVGKGMGLEFVSLPAEDLETLAAWLDEALGNLWLASNRRTSQRIQISIPVRVTGKTATGAKFEEETKTLSVGVHGGLLPLTTSVTKGQRLVISRPGSQDSMECAVVYTAHTHGKHLEVGVSFIWPNPKFWGVTFPPADWSPQHPDAKRTRSRGKRGAAE